ncbi:NAD(P)-binding protein [Xylariaceae sp. AK1471]|nr:NAD(P)-binding protein [Xylariaceae sp. AK1471]
MSNLLYQIYMKWFPIPLPAPDSFKDQTALVTGGTSGLGLAAAAHLVNLGAAEVIITSRNPARAKQALVTLEKETHGRSRDVVRIVELDMNRYDSVVALVEEVKKIRSGRGGVDFVLLNAGVAGVEFTAVDEEWEQTIQVNVLSTVLLALLLLPWMKIERKNRSSPAHLSIVGSSQHLEPDIEAWKTYIAKEGGVLAHYRDPKNWPGPKTMYGATKLMVHYAANELAELAKGEDDCPEVIINTACPGIVRTQLSRHYAEGSRAIAMALAVFFTLLAKTSENGARTLIAAGQTKENEHGKFIRFYGSQEEYQRRAQTLFQSGDGRQVQASVWSEMTSSLAAKVPAAHAILDNTKTREASD